MLAHLPTVLQPLANPQVSDLLRHGWEAACFFAGGQSIGHESDVTSLWGFLLAFSRLLFESLCPGMRLGSQAEVFDTDVLVRMDSVLQVRDEERVAIEVKRDAVYRAWEGDIDNMFGQEWLGWDGHAATEGGKYIVIKLCLWMAARNVRWGIIATERQFRVVRLQHMPIPSSGLPYPYLMMSPNINIDSGSQPLLNIILYMVLTGIDALSDIFPAPSGLKIPLSDPYALQHTRSQQATMLRSATQATQVALARGQGRGAYQEVSEGLLMSFEEYTNRGAVFGFMRTKPMATISSIGESFAMEEFSPTDSATSSTSSYASEDGILPIVMVQSFLAEGATGLCYQGTMGPVSVVVKFENSVQEEKLLEREAFLYEQYLSRLVDAKLRPIGPNFYGYFEQGGKKAVVLEYTGKTLQSFDELTPERKADLLHQTQRLHAIGLCHGDLEPRNVTQREDDGTITIIDFSHSHLHHCGKSCSELESLSRKLGIPLA
ncbi:MAG: hypothetical protein M1816_002600 [Peltula sp. TS41687]|nr:MAG: hypothetical protein M1816_002600 [Peltula sp. TS41687]